MSKIPLSYKRTDFASDQEVKWCPGCGDYTILASVQNFMTELGCLLYTSPSPRDRQKSRMPSSA